MADISSLNGYNLKDAQARSDISTINGKIGSANGIAELDNAGKVPSSQLPSYVDDVVEGYYWADADRFYEEATHQTMITPTGGKCWVDIPSNKSYRWTGSGYVRVDEGVQLGETSDTAYAGNKGKANADVIAAMKDGSSIDSFGDVETALADKADASDVTAIEGKIPSGASSSNKMATASDVAAKISWADAEKSVKRNLLTPDFSTANGTVVAGVTVTNNKGVVTLNGSSTGDNGFPIKGRIPSVHDLYLPIGKYRFSFANNTSSDIRYVVVTTYNNAARLLSRGEWGSSSFEFEITSDFQSDYKKADGSVLIGFTIEFKNATTFNNFNVYPIITKDNAPYDTFVPYIPDNTELVPRSEQAVLGAKNILSSELFTLASLKLFNTSGTWNNNVYTLNTVTFTCIEENGYVVRIDVNGTATGGNAQFLVNNRNSGKFVIPKGSWIGNGCPAGGSDNGYHMRYVETVSGSAVEHRDYGDGVAFTVESANNCGVTIYVKENGSVSNKSFYPMCRISTDPDPTFVQPAMTNRELTEKANEFENFNMSKTVYGSGTYKDLNDVTTSGMYSVWGSALNKPSDIVQMQDATLIVTNNPIGSQITQTLINGTEHNIYTRVYANDIWGSWYKFTGTVVS